MASLPFTFPEQWSPNYTTRIERNIGILSMEDQKRIKNAKIAVLGVGGLGSPLAMQLVLAGCENLILADKDTIELSNLNRQLFRQADVGKKKVDVLAENLRNINPDICLQIYGEISGENIGKVLDGVEIIALTMDGPIGSIAVAREAQKRHIPLLETWAVPYLFCWWFMPDSPNYESVYNLSTQNYSLAELQRDNQMNAIVKQHLIGKLLEFPDIKSRYANEPGALEKLLTGQIGLRSFAPVVWLNASLAAFEVIYAGIINRKEKAIAPKVVAYDYIQMKMV